MAEPETDNRDRHLIINDAPKLIIIGGGIAGISAGKYLADAGFTDFVILEATERLGGRIWTMELETAKGSRAELGATWIHGVDQNPIFKLCREQDLLKDSYQARSLGQKVLFLQEDGRPVNTKIVQEVDWNYGILMAQCEEFYQEQIPTPLEGESVGSFVEREFEEKLERFSSENCIVRRKVLQHRMLREAIINGANSMHDIPLSEVGSFEELPGVHHLIPPGFEAVIQLLKKSIPPENIALKHPVSQISWKNQGKGVPDNRTNSDLDVCVECHNGKRFYASHVLVTCSLGYLKQHADRMFNPPLPDFKSQAISRVGMGVVNKIVLEFDGQILSEGLTRLEMVWDRSNLENEEMSQRWTKKISSFDRLADNVLMGWLCGDEAMYMETLSDEEVERDILYAIGLFLKSEHIPQLRKLTRTRWGSNPYCLGAYSYLTMESSAEDFDSLAEPVFDDAHKPVVLFAGEHTHPSFYSSSHGALLTGDREARRILEFYGH